MQCIFVLFIICVVENLLLNFVSHVCVADCEHTVWQNCSQPTLMEAPWGGVKKSGLGRELGVWGLENYLEVKQITSFVQKDPFVWFVAPPPAPKAKL